MFSLVTMILSPSANGRHEPVETDHTMGMIGLLVSFTASPQE